MYQALYRKYRPSSFADVCGQEHITKTLLNQLKSGSVSHAYLFTGPRGTGKTSCAKIFAKAVNCLSPIGGDACCECESCKLIGSDGSLDISEIDAASNNGVDNIRELRGSVNYTPANGKYKVYIIDEVHMLSPGAFNALLKTLEEPPAHVIFILATTEVHKLPATIISRCQRYDFRRLAPEVIVARLNEIAEKEGITLESDAASLIAALSDGGMRDALSMLDLCAASSERITDKVVQSACAVAGKERLFALSDAVIKQDAAEALSIADALWRDSMDMQRLCEELISHFRNVMIYKSVPNPKGLVVCTSDEAEKFKNQANGIPTEYLLYIIRVLGDALSRMNTANRRAELEMAFIKLCSPELSNTDDALSARISKLESRLGFLCENGIEIKKEKPTEAVKTVAVPEEEIKEEEPERAEEPEEEDEIPLPSVDDIPAEEPDYSEPIKTAVPEAEEAPEKANTDDGGDIKPLGAWSDVLKALTPSCPLLVGVLHGSDAYIKGDYLLIDSRNPQFALLLNQALYRDYLRKAAFDVLGKNFKLGPYKNSEKSTPDVLGTITGRLNMYGVSKDKN